jgi:hypothetical protein
MSQGPLHANRAKGGTPDPQNDEIGEALCDGLPDSENLVQLARAAFRVGQIIEPDLTALIPSNHGARQSCRPLRYCNHK